MHSFGIHGAASGGRLALDMGLVSNTRDEADATIEADRSLGKWVMTYWKAHDTDLRFFDPLWRIVFVTG